MGDGFGAGAEIVGWAVVVGDGFGVVGWADVVGDGFGAGAEVVGSGVGVGVGAEVVGFGVGVGVGFSSRGKSTFWTPLTVTFRCCDVGSTYREGNAVTSMVVVPVGTPGIEYMPLASVVAVAVPALTVTPATPVLPGPVTRPDTVPVSRIVEKSTSVTPAVVRFSCCAPETEYPAGTPSVTSTDTEPVGTPAIE